MLVIALRWVHLLKSFLIHFKHNIPLPRIKEALLNRLASKNELVK